MPPEAWLLPDPEDAGLTQLVEGVDQSGNSVTSSIVHEKPLTLYLNSQEIVTMMTIGDHPEYLALGYLLNQNMLNEDDEVTGFDFDDELNVAIVRTKRQTNYEEKLKKKIKTSGCAQGTAFGDLMDDFDDIRLREDVRLKTSWMVDLTKAINTTPSLYLKAGAIHGCALCEENRLRLYMEDVGRHNAVDKIAGYLFKHQINASDKIFYTTGRLTSEMVIKTVKMGIPILISRSGFTAFGVDLARQANLTLIGRARGQRFLVLSGSERLEFDAVLDTHAKEDRRYQRKASRHD